jgi:hypothetical protein
LVNLNAINPREAATAADLYDRLKLAEKLGDPPNVATQALQKHIHKDRARNNNCITVSVGTWGWLTITADSLATMCLLSVGKVDGIAVCYRKF